MAAIFHKPHMATRFRGFLPVVVDVETGGFNAETDALLEVAAVLLHFNQNGTLGIDQVVSFNVLPFEGANLEQSSLAFTQIDPYHPFRDAIAETDAIRGIFRSVRKAVSQHGCKRAILVGHNPAFDLAFINSACKRNNIGNNPFHPFSTFDTATLGGVAFGQTVLAKAIKAAGLDWDEQGAHSAKYDAERTAQLFCNIVNLWNNHVGIPNENATDNNSD